MLRVGVQGLYLSIFVVYLLFFFKRPWKWFPSTCDTRHIHSSVSKTDVFDKCASKCTLYKGQVNNCHIADAISLSGRHSYPTAIARCLTGHLCRTSMTLVFGLLMRDVQRTSHGRTPACLDLISKQTCAIVLSCGDNSGERTGPMFVQVHFSPQCGKYPHATDVCKISHLLERKETNALFVLGPSSAGEIEDMLKVFSSDRLHREDYCRTLSALTCP